MIEHLIRRTGREWTFPRSGGFAGNTLAWAPQIRSGDVVRWVYGAAGRSLIHERDIAAVGVRVVTEDGHAGAKYVLTGPQTLTQIEQVHTIGAAVGRPLRFGRRHHPAPRPHLLPMGHRPRQRLPLTTAARTAHRSGRPSFRPSYGRAEMILLGLLLAASTFLFLEVVGEQASDPSPIGRRECHRMGRGWLIWALSSAPSRTASAVTYRNSRAAAGAARTP